MEVTLLIMVLHQSLKYPNTTWVLNKNMKRTLLKKISKSQSLAVPRISWKASALRLEVKNLPGHYLLRP